MKNHMTKNNCYSLEGLMTVISFMLYDAIISFSVWLRTSSNPADINRFLSHTVNGYTYYALTRMQWQHWSQRKSKYKKGWFYSNYNSYILDRIFVYLCVYLVCFLSRQTSIALFFTVKLLIGVWEDFQLFWGRTSKRNHLPSPILFKF